jgi:hypothetical protein
MHSPAVALAWEFWWRHRWGLAGVAAVVAGFAAACAVAPFAPNIASVHSIWFILGLCYCITVFAYGFDGRLESAESGFPPRHFVLPVRTWSLVAWPMLQATTVTAILWLAWNHLVLRPSGIDMPFWWKVMVPALAATCQAIVWLPFGLPSVRILVAIVVLGGLLRAPAFLELAGDEYAEPETQNRILSIFSAILMPLAFVVAWAGVTLARRGDTPDWSHLLRANGSDRRAARERRPFTSPMRAQIWYDWRSRGRLYLVTVVLSIAAWMALGLILERNTDRLVGYGFVYLATSMVLATFWGTLIGTSGESVRKATGLSAFLATRPMSNSDLVVAKVWTAGIISALGWLISVFAFVGWQIGIGGVTDISSKVEAIAAALGPARTAALVALMTLAPPLLSWRVMAVNLYVGLTSRQWIIVSQGIVASFIGLQFMYEWTLWGVDPVRTQRIIDALPWLAGVAIAAKLLLAGWCLRRLHRRGDLSARGLRAIPVAWLAAVAVLFALLMWLVPEGFVPRYGLAFAAVLAVPLARLVLAPLALASNRHR